MARPDRPARASDAPPLRSSGDRAGIRQSRPGKPRPCTAAESRIPRPRMRIGIGRSRARGVCGREKRPKMIPTWPLADQSLHGVRACWAGAANEAPAPALQRGLALRGLLECWNAGFHESPTGPFGGPSDLIPKAHPRINFGRLFQCRGPLARERPILIRMSGAGIMPGPRRIPRALRNLAGRPSQLARFVPARGGRAAAGPRSPSSRDHAGRPNGLCQVASGLARPLRAAGCHA
jgi:hypothetical protein